MKSLNESKNYSSQLLNLKTSLSAWDDLISRSSKLTASASITIQCMSGFLEAFQKISDVAEANNTGLRSFGIAMRRFCIRQKSVESHLRNFNSQLNDCLVTPLSDRLDEWRRTANQIDRDFVKEIRKAKSELQRAMLEAEKCKKRLRRKDRGALTAAFDEFDASNVQINFAQHDLTVKQRALEQLEQRCLEAIAVEERRRFAELSTCLNPVFDAQLSVLAELRPLEEAVKAIQAAQPAVYATPHTSVTSLTSNSDTFCLRSTPLVKPPQGGTHPTPPALIDDPAIATGSAALPYAVAVAPSQLSITSVPTNFCAGGLFGVLESTTTLHSPDAEIPLTRLPPPQPPASTGLGSPGPDALSLFDHNQSLSGPGTVNSNDDAHSVTSSDSLGLLPVNYEGSGCLGSVLGEASSSGGGVGGEVTGDRHPFPPRRTSSFQCEEDEDGGTTEGCLTDDDDDEDDDDNNHDESSEAGQASNHVSGLVATMEKSILYPNQALPPPVYTNLWRLQAAAAAAVPGAAVAKDKPVDNTSSVSCHAPPSSSCSSTCDPNSGGRKLSQPTATISKAGMSALLRSLSISGRSGIVPPPTLIGADEGLGAGEGLSLSPPPTSSMTPVIADQETSNPDSPTAYAQARSRIDSIFSSVESGGVFRSRPEPKSSSTAAATAESSPSPVNDVLGMTGGLNSPGNTSTFRRRHHQQQQQQQQPQRTAGVNMTRGSMFQLNTSPDIDCNSSQDIRYGYGMYHYQQQQQQQPMTPGPGRKTSAQTQASGDSPVGAGGVGQAIRPPRRSSSVCRELPSLSQQQQQQQTIPKQPQQVYAPGRHYAAPRGAQEHPQCIYAEPRPFQQQQHHQQQQNGLTTISATAAQLAAEAAAARRLHHHHQQQQHHQQQTLPQQQQRCVPTSGLRTPTGQRIVSPTPNGVIGPTRLPQRQPPVATNGSGGMASTNKETPKTAPQQCYEHAEVPGGIYQYHQGYPPPPTAFEDVESTSFIEQLPSQ